MKRMSLIVLPILAVAILTLCHGATADIISGSETVDYKYDATSQGGTWAKTIDAGAYGSPQWLQSFFPGEEWIYIPDLGQTGNVEHLWFEVQWQSPPSTQPSAPTVWVPQGSLATVAGGTNPVQVENGYVWEWTIDPQPGQHLLEIPATFSWNQVTGIEIASSRTLVPEPSMLVLMGSMGTLALVRLGWKRKRAR